MNPSFSIPARFAVEMSARLKVKKDALEYKNYFFLLNKNEVLIEASKKSRKASKKI